MNKLEVAAGLEPAKIGFADRRLDHFGIATLYPNLYPKLYPNRPLIAYLPHATPLQVVDSACDCANEMVLQTIALPLGDRATGRKSCQFSVLSYQSKKMCRASVLHLQTLGDRTLLFHSECFSGDSSPLLVRKKNA
jgi:hypothetical protein